MNTAKALAFSLLILFLGALSLTALERGKPSDAGAGKGAVTAEWEYKVLGDAFQTAEKLQLAFNHLSADGWEYVGPTRLFDARYDCSVFRKAKTK